MESKILRVGIIGCGKISQSHRQAYPDHPHAVVVGFYDRIINRAVEWKDQISKHMSLIKEAAIDSIEDDDKIHLKRCEIFENEARVYHNVHDLIKNVDVIDIAAPNYAHIPYAIWALKQNKSVMSEKPPALCSLETKQILEIAKNSQGFYQINENFFWQAYIRELKTIVEENLIGDLKKINIKLGHGVPSWGWQNHFLNPSLSGGGVLSDMGFHAIGIVFCILGKGSQVSKVQSIRMQSGTQKEKTLRDADGANKYYLQKFMVEDEAEVKAWFDSSEKKKDNQQIEATIETSWSKTYQTIVLEGTEGSCSVEFGEKKQRILKISNNNKEITIREIPPQGRDSHQLEVVDFLNRISNGKRPYADENMAHEMQVFISGAYLSNLLAFEASSPNGIGIPVTPEDLDNFYEDIANSGCPSNFQLEEVVYRFMIPFTSSFQSREQNFGE